jgi:hypothetical protein
MSIIRNFPTSCLCSVGPFHHGMVGAHGFHIWRVAANIVNNQSGTVDKG